METGENYTFMDLFCCFETDGKKLRYIASELVKEPFYLDITFDRLARLTYDEALEVFNNILAEIDPKMKTCDDEDPAERIDRVVQFLCILKYKPRNGDNPSDLLRGMFQRRSTDFIWRLMEWIFPRMDELKKRAYLSNFLVKINIPLEFMVDPEIDAAYEAYENQIERFKEVHKKHESLKMAEGVVEFAKDIKQMEHDIDCISRRLETVKARISMNDRNNEENLELARKFNRAKEMSKELRLQKVEDERILNYLEVKCYHKERILRELKRYVVTSDGGDWVIQQLKKNHSDFKLVAEVKVPQDIMEVSRSVCAMEIVESQPLLTEADLIVLKQKIKEAKKSIVDMQECRNTMNESLALEKLRMEAKTTSLRKSMWRENIEKMLQDCLHLTSKLEEKRIEKKMKETGRTADKARYHKVTKMMQGYKQMKSEMNNLQSEVGILSTTKFILEGEQETSISQVDSINSLESLIPQGRPNIMEIPKPEAILDNMELLRCDQDAIQNVFKLYSLNTEMKEKTSLLDTKRNRIENLRQEECAAEQIIKKLSCAYETIAMEIEKPIREKTRMIENMKQELTNGQLLHSKLIAEISVMNGHLNRAKNELDLQGINTDPNGMINLKRVQSFKDKLLTGIVEQERMEKETKEALSEFDKMQDNREHQLEMWSDLTKILEKKICIANQLDYLE